MSDETSAECCEVCVVCCELCAVRSVYGTVLTRRVTQVLLGSDRRLPVMSQDVAIVILNVVLINRGVGRVCV